VRELETFRGAEDAGTEVRPGDAGCLTHGSVGITVTTTPAESRRPLPAIDRNRGLWSRGLLEDERWPGRDGGRNAAVDGGYSNAIDGLGGVLLNAADLLAHAARTSSGRDRHIGACVELLL
jgi:hypothetical protein